MRSVIIILVALIALGGGGKWYNGITEASRNVTAKDSKKQGKAGKKAVKASKKTAKADKKTAKAGETSSSKAGRTSSKTSYKTVAPFDFTPKTTMDGMRLERSAYTLLYNREKRLPLWVAWHLTAQHTTGSSKRAGLKFMEDEDVPSPRATNMDYVNSGYDRGHMCPSGDNKWSELAQQESFLYTNCCPQLHNLNAGDWEELESRCRQWAKRYGDIYIVCGPVFLNKKHKTIGRNKVVVPEAFYKVVLCMKGTPKGIGFIYRNESTNKKMASYVNTIDDVERITGIDFFPALPDNIEKKVEATANLSDWD